MNIVYILVCLKVHSIHTIILEKQSSLVNKRISLFVFSTSSNCPIIKRPKQFVSPQKCTNINTVNVKTK